MNLRIIIFLSFLQFSNLFSQSYEKDWPLLEKKINSVSACSMKEVEDFASRYSKQLGSNPDNAMKLYSMWAYKYWEKRDMKTAEEKFVNSYEYALKATDTSWKYTAVYRLGDFYRSTNNFVEAEKYYYYCLRPLSVILGQSSREYTQIFYEYTLVLIGLGKYDAASPYIDGLLYYYKTLDGENNIRYLTLLNYKAIIAQNKGNYNNAIEIFTSLADGNKYLQLGDTAMYITGLNNLGNIYREVGNYEQAFYYLKKGKQEFYRLKISDRIQLASLENNLGLCYKAVGNTREAEDAYNAGIILYKEMGDKDLEAYCSVMNNKGDLLRELGRLGEASEILLTSIETRKKYFGTQSIRYANALSNLAIVYYDAGFYQKSLEKNLEAEDVYRNTVGESHQAYGNCLNNLSLCYLQSGDYKKAEDYKLRALKIVENSVGKNHYRYASFLISTCALYFKTGQLDKAEKNLHEALALVEKNLGKKHDLYAHAELLLAEILSQTKRYEQATPLYFESMDHYTGLLNSYFDAMSEDQQMHYYNLISPLLSSFNLFVMNYRQKYPSKNLSEHMKRSFNNQLLLKSLLNSRSAHFRQQVFSSGDQQLIKLYQDWRALQNELINGFKTESQNADNNPLMEKINAIETELKKKLGPFESNSRADFEAVKKNLGTEEAAVEIFKVNEVVKDTVTEARYGIYVVKKNSVAPELVTYGNGDLLDGAYFTSFTRCIDNQWQDTLSYDAYFRPLKNKLGGTKKIYISSEGIFNKISIAGLYDTKQKKYVEDEYEICLSSNLSSIGKKSAKEIKSAEAVLFGYPDYDFDFATQKQSSAKTPTSVVASRFGLSSLPALPGTKKEVEQIETELKNKGWNVNVFMRENASEENLRRINAPKILHIATHGYYLKDVESDDKAFMGFETSYFKSISLLRSGIILAGAGPATTDSVNRKSENDGIVTAYEASLLNLNNTELVVLSACQTGLGDDYGSQGVGGLQRSLAIAGAKNIIMSLWPVDDDATQELMTSFYRNYVSSGNVEEAFKLAKKEVRKKFSHPYYWSAFVLLKTFN